MAPAVAMRGALLALALCLLLDVAATHNATSGQRRSLQSDGQTCPEGGLLKGRVCCAATCNTCGGTGCKADAGGAANCCVMDIVRSHRPCAFNEPPCVLGTGVPKHGSAGSASHVRDAYSFLKARLEKDGDPNCHGQEEKHSMSYIDNVRERLTSPYADVCKPWENATKADSLKQGPLMTSIKCAHEANFDGVRESFCDASNFAIDLKKFKEYMTHPRRTDNPDNNGYAFSGEATGSLIGVCKMEQQWRRDQFGWGGQYWLYSSLRTLADPSEEPSEQPNCLAWVDHPLYVMGSLYGSGNPWHTLEDVTHMFETFAIFGLDGDTTQVVVADMHPDVAFDDKTRPYDSLYRQAFSTHFEPQSLANLLKPHLAQADSVPNAAVCFKRGVFSVHGGVSILSNAKGYQTTCRNSTFIKGLLDFTVDGLGLNGYLPASSSSRDAPLLVSYALRGSKAHDAARNIHGERDVLDAVSALAERLGFRFEKVDFGALTPPEQFKAARRSDVLIGPHGAALTHAFWMADNRAVIELGGNYRCLCYHNLAIWGGRSYWNVQEQGDFPSAVAKELEEALRRIDWDLGRGNKAAGSR